MNDTVVKTKYPATPQALAIVGWAALVIGAFLLLAVGMSWVARVTFLGTMPSGADGGGEMGASRLPAGQALAFPTPDFRLPSLDGGTISPADYLGKVVVVDFWATWCGPCRLQAKVLEDLRQEVGDDVQFLAVDIGEDEATVRDYVAKRPFPYPVLLDTADTLSAPYNIYGLPTVMVIGPTGQVVFHQTGVTDLDQLRKEVAAARS